VTRPLILLPSSKAKAAGGDGTPYGESAAVRDGALAEARVEVLRALADAAETLDDTEIARLCGVKPDDVTDHRARLATLADAPTLAALHRYTGVVHRFAGLPELPPPQVTVDLLVLGGLLGAARHDEPVPDYRIEVTGRLPPLGVLGTWWRRRLGAAVRAQAQGRRVWDLLPGEFARLWPSRERDGLAVTTVRFERADGRAAPSASAKVAKGQLLGLLLSEPHLDPCDLRGDEALPGWDVRPSEGGLTAVQVA
jgi:uncharacterized protein